jgi:hypothetical protein
MNQDNNTNNTPGITSLGRKSWTAYVRIHPYALAAILCVMPFVSGFATNGGWRVWTSFGFWVLALSLPFLIYRLLYLKSVHLYFDDEGVWVYSGFLPWKKGVYGMKWRDIESASYSQSMGSWLFKSYSITVFHRFIGSSAISLDHMACGDEAVMAINSRHAELIGANTLS